jgi:HlyD family secretion protein
LAQTRILTGLACGAVLLAGSAALLSMKPPAGETSNLTIPFISGATASRAVTVAATTDTVVAPNFGRIAARGRIEPISEPLELALGVVGTLAHVYVDQGDKVHKDQLLADLISDDQKARVDEASATVQLREAELTRLLNGARPEERQEAAARLDELKARLTLAGQELGRQRSLATMGVASLEALDHAVSSHDETAAQVNASAQAVALINAPPRDEDVAIARANLGLAQAQLKEQQSLLEKTEVRSPIDGVILRRYMKSGETIAIQPLLPIVEVADTGRLRVRAEIDEVDVARVAVGQAVWISADAYPGQRFHGKVTRIAPRLGRKTVGSDNPAEKTDTNVMDVLVDLDANAHLPIGLRVDVDVDVETQQVARD